MEIRPIQSSELEAARQLLLANGWDRKVATLPRFYEKLGFSVSTVAMERPAKKKP